MDDLERTLQDYGQAWRDAQPPPGAAPVVGGAGPGRRRIAVLVAAAAAVVLVVAAIAAATKGDGSHAQRVATPGPDASGTIGSGAGSSTTSPLSLDNMTSTTQSSVIQPPASGIVPPSSTLPSPPTLPHPSTSMQPPQTTTTMPRVQPDSCPGSVSAANDAAKSGSLPVSGVSKVTVCHYPGLNSPGAQQLDRSAAVDGSAAQQIADTLNGLQAVPTNVGYMCPMDDGETDLVEVRTSSGLDAMTVSLLGCRMVVAGSTRWWSSDELRFELVAVLGS